MANLGNVSTININGNELTIKDSALTELVSEIVEAIGENNEDISQHINDLNDKAFDNLIKITSNNESEISNIQDGLYKLQYITTSGEEPNITETLTNSAILIQKGTNQYLIKDGQLLSRIKTNNTWGTWTSTIPEQVQSNWNEGSTASPAYIQNKPKIYNLDVGSPVSFGTKMVGLSGECIKMDGSITITNTQVDNGNFAKIELGNTGGDDDTIKLTSNGSDGGVYVSTDTNKFYYNNKEVATKNDIIQSDWNEGSTASAAYIKNKPTIPTVPTTSTTVTENDTNPVSGGAVYSKIADLIGSAPAALDTLQEIAAALNNDADLAGTLTTQISQKIPKVTGATTGNFASFNSDGTISDSGHKHSDYVTSVNGATGDVVINLALATGYAMATAINDDLELEEGDTFEEAFSKIEKRIEDNELVTAAAITDLDTRINGINIPVIPVTSVNGQTGAITVNAPVTSVNGATGDVIINLALATGYAMATAINDDLFLEGGDTYEEAFSKLEKSLNDNEEIVTTALIDLDDRVSVVEDKTSDLRIIASVTGYGNAVTGVTASGMSLTITKGASYITTHQNIKTLNSVSLKGTGNINVVNSVNGMTGAVVIPISATVVANDTNPISGGAVYTEISTLIGGAPDALNTLGEIATALNNDADLASTLTNQITSRMPKVTGATAGNFASLAADGTLVNSGHSHNDYVTSVNGQTGTVNIGTLPAVTAADNGKILMVVNGQWEAVSPTILYSGTGIPNNANGNNGDIYIQTE